MTTDSAPDAESQPVIGGSRVTVQIAIISDTHMPRGSRALPAECLVRLTTADLVIHAGDFTRLEVLEQLRALSEVVAVHGNMDDAQVRTELPVSALMNTGEHRIGIIHDAGPAAGRLRRMKSRFPEADAVIFGHSHIPLHERAPDGFQIFNPGSPTDRRRAAHHTMGICQAGGELRFQIVELD